MPLKSGVPKTVVRLLECEHCLQDRERAFLELEQPFFLIYGLQESLNAFNEKSFNKMLRNVIQPVRCLTHSCIYQLWVRHRLVVQLTEPHYRKRKVLLPSRKTSVAWWCWDNVDGCLFR